MKFNYLYFYCKAQSISWDLIALVITCVAGNMMDTVLLSIQRSKAEILMVQVKFQFPILAVIFRDTLYHIGHTLLTTEECCYHNKLQTKHNKQNLIGIIDSYGCVTDS